MPVAVSDADAVRYAIQQTADRLTGRLHIARTDRDKEPLDIQG